jgi:hypothetical protein
MFRSLVSARKNADELELNVTLLHHSICVFGHQLTTVFDPNEVLRQHFDVFKNEVGDRVYHPMKTFDSLSLYSLPVIKILTRWRNTPRLLAKLVSQAKYDPEFAKQKSSEVSSRIAGMIQETIDIFSRLSDSFEEIDKVNAQYTKAVQKKVNYLASSDKSVKGKLDAIILEIAKQLDKKGVVSEADIDGVEIVRDVASTISIYRQGFVNSESLTLPFKRTLRGDSDPLPLADPLDGLDDPDFDMLMQEQNRFSEEAVENFMLKNFGNKRIITSQDIALNTGDDFILLILAVVRAEFGDMFYTIDKKSDQIRNGRFYLPCYTFTRKGRTA